MALRIPFGVDPEEVWEIDYVLESARSTLRIQEETAKALTSSAADLKDAERKAALLEAGARSERAAVDLKKEIEAYVMESGPVFKVKPVPGRKRAELLGRHQEGQAMPDGPGKMLAVMDWSREVVATTVLGHRNLRRPDGRDIPFASENGRPSEQTMEAYSPIINDLAFVIFAQQRLGDAGKNG